MQENIEIKNNYKTYNCKMHNA